MREFAHLIAQNTSRKKRREIGSNDGTFLNLTGVIQRRVMEFCDEFDLGALECVCKNFRKLCKRPYLPQDRWAEVYVVNGCIHHLVQSLYKFNAEGVFRRFLLLRIVGVHMLNHISKQNMKWAIRRLRRLNIDVIHLDISLPPQIGFQKVYGSVIKSLSAVMPKLQRVTINNVSCPPTCVTDICKNAPDLRYFEWQGSNSACTATGWHFRHVNTRHALRSRCNITEVRFDNSSLSVQADNIQQGLLTLEGDDKDFFLLCMLTESLARVSIKNTSVHVLGRVNERIPISQKALMKCARLLPRLKWFRSDLTAENIAILKVELPQVHFTS